MRVSTGSERRRPRTLPLSARAAFALGAAAVFFVILLVRGGPNPAETDAHAVTLPTTAISDGALRSAEQATLVPNPPGYPLLMSPVVLVFRPWIGAPRWCDDKPFPDIASPQIARYFRSVLDPCSAQSTAAPSLRRPSWYRSQALLVILAWAVLAGGGVLLMRAAGMGMGFEESLLVVGLALLPASTDAVAQSFHPQDLMSVGFSCAGMAQALRRRWVLVGLAFGAAFLCKQFAILPFVAVLAAAPSWRDRGRSFLPALGLVAAGVLPFYVADPADTLHAMSAVYVAGVNVVKTSTVLGLLGIDEHLKLEIARDAPLVGAVILASWARWRRPDGLLAPAPLVGLALACLALRLVFEVSILDYYYLAVGAVLLVLDFVRGRVPVLAAAWIVATRYGLNWLITTASPPVIAWVFLAAALLAAGIGVAVVLRTSRREEVFLSLRTTHAS
jgi:hypothetical protein